MKSIYKKVIFFAICIFAAGVSFAQCKSEECVSKLSDGFTFLKTYSMENSAGQAEYSYVFSKDTNYMLMICNKDGGGQNVVVTVFDSNRKEIATNFDKKSNKYYPAIVYACKSTGIYYLKFTFNEKPDCCSSILAFKK